MDPEGTFYPRALARIHRLMLALGIAGTIGALFIVDFRYAFGFALGAAASWINFRWIHRFVEALGPGGRRPGKWLAIALALRYPLLALGGYAIVKFFGLSVIAVLLGFFVPVAAVIFEILYELIYAGT